jgi:hypothetical protein
MRRCSLMYLGRHADTRTEGSTAYPAAMRPDEPERASGSAWIPSGPLPAPSCSTCSCCPTSSEPTGSASSGASRRVAPSPSC